MTTVAFLGLGHMGGPMAANLLAAGHTVRGFDPVPALRAAAEEKGAQVFESGLCRGGTGRWGRNAVDRHLDHLG
jgi:3-hydroxyisobutyrate dehydrogenase-like beta-hydroxyacid dehydrogenase